VRASLIVCIVPGFEARGGRSRSSRSGGAMLGS
jgi:hypothetical protein